MNRMQKNIAALFAALLPALASAQGMSATEPTRGLMPTPAKGKMLFEKNCAKCHGTDLKGTDQGPPLVHKIYESSHHSNAAFQMAARHGARAHHWQFGDMPPRPRGHARRRGPHHRLCARATATGGHSVIAIA
jgi:mono/diheme cytochrome c family protein